MVWDCDYNALSQPTQYEHPNGMDTVYSYDGLNRLTKIEHKDGVTVMDSFAYVLDDVGNLESVEQVDGSVWDYWYGKQGQQPFIASLLRPVLWRHGQTSANCGTWRCTSCDATGK